MKFAALLLLLAFSAFAQELPPVAGLESFFRTVELRARIADTLPANSPSIQAALSFTDSEMKSLNAIASAFVNRAAILRAPTGDVIFQSRLDFADTGKESDTASQQIKAMEAQVAAALAQAASQLRAALGDERYREFDSWLRARRATGCWVAPCSAVPKR